ncbi:unnamed protein product [Gemmata massiliana]|uniref:Uncharacterized protein n=1 Tax=Gemmata massiliana TaxID=1210884 RepID=A0A6P2D994_9BACT|nr:hypothetical protein [Gemmata massiliana]VTR96060.1 unnamed protein product [Gemmata massiliana]
MAESTKTYVERLKEWVLYVVAILSLSIASALAQRWLGKDVPLPPPPVILVTSGVDGITPVVQVFPPDPSKDK